MTLFKVKSFLNGRNKTKLEKLVIKTLTKKITKNNTSFCSDYFKWPFEQRFYAYI